MVLSSKFSMLNFSFALMQFEHYINLMEYRIGQGYDIHRLVKEGKLILGGVEIPFESGLLGHSDGDVLCHAITDAIIGAAGMGDIGHFFPNTDESIRGISSVTILAEILTKIKLKLWKIGNIDATIIAESPKLAPYINDIREKIAHVLRIPSENINIKAKTGEGLGPVGEGRAIEAQAVVLLFR